MSKVIGYAFTGSFCTFDKSIKQMERLVEKGYMVVPIFSYNASKISTRFGESEKIIEEAEKITGNNALKTITEVEPIGPEKMFDILIVSPCSATTIGKLASGIFDTPVTLAVKSHLRNQRPVLIGISTNDALSTSAGNIGTLLNYRNFFFIPMGQDDYERKPFSVVARFDKTVEAVENALNGKQIQPILAIE